MNRRRDRMVVGWRVQLLWVLVVLVLDDADRTADVGVEAVVADWKIAALSAGPVEPFAVYYHHR